MAAYFGEIRLAVNKTVVTKRMVKPSNAPQPMVRTTAPVKMTNTINTITPNIRIYGASIISNARIPAFD